MCVSWRIKIAAHTHNNPTAPSSAIQPASLCAHMTYSSSSHAIALLENSHPLQCVSVFSNIYLLQRKLRQICVRELHLQHTLYALEFQKNPIWTSLWCFLLLSDLINLSSLLCSHLTEMGEAAALQSSGFAENNSTGCPALQSMHRRSSDVNHPAETHTPKAFQLSFTFFPPLHGLSCHHFPDVSFFWNVTPWSSWNVWGKK